MAKSMKVPVLVFEHIQETEILMEGLKYFTSRVEKGSHKEELTKKLKEEIQKTNAVMAMVNIN